MLETILIILAFIAIVGACIYFYVEMKDHKATNNTDFEKISKNIEEEEKTRLGNIKFVVDQVNDKNEAMDTEYMKEITALKAIDTGFGKLIQAENSTGGSVAMKDVTDTSTSKIKLMKDVSVIGSMSIKDLEISARTSTSIKPSFRACGVGIGSSLEKCIEFPNTQGDTYLTAFDDTKSVVSGSTFKANRGAEIVGVLKTDTINNITSLSPITIQTINGTTIGNTITVANTVSNGITLTSGNGSIEIKDGVINIKPTGTDLSNIQLKGRAISETIIPSPSAGGELTLPELTTALAGKKLLTIAAS